MERLRNSVLKWGYHLRKFTRPLSFIVGQKFSMPQRTRVIAYNTTNSLPGPEKDTKVTEFTLKELQKYQPPARIHRVELGSVTQGRVTEGRQLRIQHSVDLHHRRIRHSVRACIGLYSTTWA